MVQVSGQQGVPVITIDGQVIVGFDQPRLRQLLAGARPAKPRLGASVADVAAQAQQHPGLPASGAYVGSVRAGSVAARAGLQAGDVIVALGSYPVKGAADLHRLIPEMPAGKDLALTYIRNGREERVTIRL